MSTSWQRILGLDDLAEGRVMTVTVGRHSLAVTHHEGRYGALDNRCPHQGGPLGEGSIEKGCLRCPWHGYDYDPITGTPPPPFNDAPSAYPTEVRDDGVYAEIPDDEPRPRTVSDVLVETMTHWGVTHVFGIVGHSNLGFADGLRKAEARGELTYIGVRHEGAAAFAATAFGKLTGGLAACFGIAGPGSTNLLTGLYDAKVDRAPVLAISGQVPSAVKGRGAFQDVDLEGAFDDVAEYSETVHSRSNHAELMSLACKHAIVGRAVAHLILPDEVQVQEAPDAPPGRPEGRVAVTTVSPPADELDRAATMLASAHRPMIVVGAGARFDMPAILELAERLNAPVATTFKAKGQISDSHPLGCGVLGRSGTPIASWLMNESDTMLVFGASFSNHTGIADYKPLIQVDFDPMGLGRFHAVDVPLLGHVGVTSRALQEALPESLAGLDQRPDVAERWAIWRAEKARRRGDDQSHGVSSAIVIDALSRTADADAAIAVDVGNNTYSFGRYFEVVDQSVVMSGYLGSIGFALPAAMGLWASVGDRRQVIAICGDGGLGQYAMELTTLVKYGMNVTVVVLNNSELGKISKEQRAAELDVWQTSLHNPDFAAFAELCGAWGRRVTQPGEVSDALAGALQHDGPALVDIVTDAALV